MVLLRGIDAKQVKYPAQPLFFFPYRSLSSLPPSPPSPSTRHCAARHGELFGGVRVVRSWQHALAGDRRAGALHRQLRAGVPGAGAAGRQDGRGPGVGQQWQNAAGQSLNI